jgi:hypothetical protein
MQKQMIKTCQLIFAQINPIVTIIISIDTIIDDELILLNVAIDVVVVLIVDVVSIGGIIVPLSISI